MRMMVTVVSTLVAAVVFVGLMALPAEAGASCHLLNARGVGEDLGGGAILGDVIGGGLLHGTIAGNITPTGLSGNIASFVETITFTNQHGTLTVVVTGVIDITTGQFDASGPVTAATGKLSGATGELSFSGAVNFATADFIEDITGFVCVDLAP
jgi:hypothetical protein